MAGIIVLPRIATPQTEFVPKYAPDVDALFRANTLYDWAANPESAKYMGLLMPRPFHGAWDSYQADIDDASCRWGRMQALTASASNRSPRLFARSVDGILEEAGFPAPLTAQLKHDACAMGDVVSALCPLATSLEIKLEIFGENTCARWHQDHFVARSIVSYTGPIGTEYARPANVNWWELKHCGCNDKIVHDVSACEHVDVGDFLLIKGNKFPHCPQGLVHKSPEKTYDAQGNILNRLVLKVDVMAPPPDAQKATRGSVVSAMAAA